jgi:hypothetical protein
LKTVISILQKLSTYQTSRSYNPEVDDVDAGNLTDLTSANVNMASSALKDFVEQPSNCEVL